MKKISKIHLLLLIVTLAGFFLRFWRVASIPPILNRDEASLAYNGLLLSQVGKDEWGVRWPLALQSFGDYKLIGYPAVLAFLFRIFNPSDLIVRLPSVVAGTLLIPITFLLGKKLGLKPIFSILFSLGIATAPVFIFYSRIAFEANLALFFITLAFYLLQFQRRSLDLVAVMLWFFASIIYNTPLLLIPGLVLFLILSRGVKNWRSWILPSCLLGLIFIVVFWALSPLTQQKSSITIFDDETTWNQFVIKRDESSGITKRIWYNYSFYLARIVLKNAVNSFSPDFLVTNGGSHPWHSIPAWGNIFTPVYLGSLFFFIYLIGKSIKARSPADLALFLLFLYSLLPSVVTVDSPHTTRSLFFLYLLHFYFASFFQILATFRPSFKKIILPVTILVIVLCTSKYMFDYLDKYPTQSQVIFQGGFDQAINELNQKGDMPMAVVDSGGYQYILASWYLKIPPINFYSTQIRQLPDRIGFRYGEQVLNFHFIAQASDASDQEKYILFWNGQSWEIKPN